MQSEVKQAGRQGCKPIGQGEEKTAKPQAAEQLKTPFYYHKRYQEFKVSMPQAAEHLKTELARSHYLLPEVSMPQPAEHPQPTDMRVRREDR